MSEEPLDELDEPSCFCLPCCLEIKQPPFRPRSFSECVEACGLDDASPDLRAALDLGCGVVGEASQTDHLFRMLAKPKEGDWLQMMFECGQTFHQFRLCSYRSPPEPHMTILLLPMLDLTNRNIQHFFEHLVQY